MKHIRMILPLKQTILAYECIIGQRNRTEDNKKAQLHTKIEYMTKGASSVGRVSRGGYTFYYTQDGGMLCNLRVGKSNHITSTNNGQN